MFFLPGRPFLWTEIVHVLGKSPGTMWHPAQGCLPKEIGALGRPRFNRGCARVDLKDLPGALNDFNETIDLWPSLALTQSERGEAGFSETLEVFVDFRRIDLLQRKGGNNSICMYLHNFA